MTVADELAFLSGPPDTAARRLLGCHLIRKIEDQILVGRIVETEAYHQSDAASHSHKGRTARTEVMFGAPGFLYVYFIYGMHYCCNVVTGPAGEGSAVLIRALEPLEGQATMNQNRPGRGVSKHRASAVVDLTNGPAKLCQALGIDTQCNGHNLRHEPLRLVIQPALKPEQFVQTTRIGISRAIDLPWRFYIKDNCYVSDYTASKS